MEELATEYNLSFGSLIKSNAYQHFCNFFIALCFADTSPICVSPLLNDFTMFNSFTALPIHLVLCIKISFTTSFQVHSLTPFTIHLFHRVCIFFNSYVALNSLIHFSACLHQIKALHIAFILTACLHKFIALCVFSNSGLCESSSIQKLYSCLLQFICCATMSIMHSTTSILLFTTKSLYFHNPACIKLQWTP